ncbi:MAG: exodeoxyribonuclease VII large subunit [Bacteroidales bacterium]|nr:exodeoxyribonuclease VII large subunit [Bacteroidales bacterium]
MITGEVLSLSQLQERVTRLVTNPATQNVWVTAELMDVSTRGHCYMELVEKDDRGKDIAKIRGIIWASTFARIGAEFYAATGQRFATGLKVMVRGSINNSPLYGMSLIITAINPEYTMGDLLRRRNEILARLQAEGILEMNRQIPWPVTPWRIAVVSAPLAAGYGDFINQLYNNPSRLRFRSKLFAATMQGESAVPTIIAALEQIAMEDDAWDCVVIIRGGGATSDLASFESYELASHIAQFPLPVIVGIGHERDITVLDYVANMRVKTPTAAATWLISQGEKLLNTIARLGSDIAQAATQRISDAKEQLSYYQGLLPVAPTQAISRAQQRLTRAISATASISGRRIAPQLARLDSIAASLPAWTAAVTQRQRTRLDSLQQLLDALSPQATLARGYSITRVDGKVVTSANEIPAGATLSTTLAKGEITSIVK